MQTIPAQDIVDSVREGLIVLDAQLSVVSANQGFYEIFQADPAVTIGRRIYDLGNGQWQIPALRQLLEDILPQERSVEAFEVDHVFPEVGRKIIALNARRVMRLDAEIEHILVTFYDVTEVRHLQQEAARAARTMREIVDTIRDPLVILDIDLKITTASRNFLGLFGMTTEEVIGKGIDELEQGQWDVTALTAMLQRVVPEDRPFDDFLVEDEFPGLGLRIFKLNARKIFVPGNHVTNLLLVFEDVTDAIADRHKDLLAAELAHRIKNSLSVISAFVAFEIRRAAEPCVAGFQAMQTRINAVAKLYDVIAKSSALGPVDMPAYLNGIADSLRASLLGDNSGIVIEVKSEDLQIVSDHAVPIGLLVNELATNAVKYAFPQNVGRITLGVRRRDGEVTLFVEDDGIGMDSTALRSMVTSGMGSRFIEAFVEQIGGTLARATSPDGTTVTIRLPSSILA